MPNSEPRYINKDDLLDLVDFQEAFLRDVFPQEHIYQFVAVMMTMLQSFSRRSSKETIECIISDDKVCETIMNLSDHLELLLHNKMNEAQGRQP